MWFDLLSGLESREIGLGCSIGVHAREFRLTYDDLALEVSVLRLPKIVHESGDAEAGPGWREILRTTIFICIRL
jgi:hypothetical protein